MVAISSSFYKKADCLFSQNAMWKSFRLSVGLLGAAVQFIENGLAVTDFFRVSMKAMLLNRLSLLYTSSSSLSLLLGVHFAC